jgi:hypothetical protein
MFDEFWCAYFACPATLVRQLQPAGARRSHQRIGSGLIAKMARHVVYTEQNTVLYGTVFPSIRRVFNHLHAVLEKNGGGGEGTN